MWMMDEAKTSHQSDHLHACDNTQAGVHIVSVFSHHSFWRAVFVCPCVYGFLYGSKLYCAELSLTIGCHGDVRLLGLMVCKKSLAQVKSKELLICLALLSLSLSLSDLMY